MSLQVVVVVNNSSDGSTKIIKEFFPEISLIQAENNLGFAKANNLALLYAKAPLILFLNPDTIIYNNSLKIMTEFLKSHPKVGAVGPKILDNNGEIFNLGLQWFPSPLTELFNLLFVSYKTIDKIKNFLPYKDKNNSGYVSKLYGACLMVRREVLEEVGSFDDRFFMYCEDVDLCKRITDSGWKIYYLSDAVIVHIGGGASEKAYSQFSTLMKCQSISELMKKYYGKPGKLLYKLFVLVGSGIRLSIVIILKIKSSILSGHDRPDRESGVHHPQTGLEARRD